MSKPIYKLCLVRGYTEAYYQLSEEEKKVLWENLGKVLGPTGAEQCTPYYDCRWSNDQYITWFIMKYPDIESAIADTHATQSIQLERYLISETILGIESEDDAKILAMNASPGK